MIETCDDLWITLKKYADEINETSKKYHASVDNSGAMPQLNISQRS